MIRRLLRRNWTFRKTYRLGGWVIHIHERRGRFVRTSCVVITNERKTRFRFTHS